jgi:3-oxoacyl-[acyl-carrier-protein] synthase II
LSSIRRRVVITGLGPVTAAGVGVDALREGLRRGVSPVATVTAFDPAPFRSRMAAEVSDFDPLQFMDDKTARRTDRFVQFALAAATLAVQDAGLGGPDLGGAGVSGLGQSELSPTRTTVQLGSAMGGIAHAEAQLRRYLERGARALDPRLATTTFAGAASCQLAIHLGVTGPNSTNAMSCAAGTMAIGEAARLIREGTVDAALAGGADAPLAPVCYGAFASLRAMSKRNDEPAAACRPFDMDRDGFVMGEGACVLVLEERQRAEARGARIYAEVAGYASNNDAYHMVAPRPDGSMAAAAITTALDVGSLSSADVDHVNAHASATVLNDETESRAIRTALGGSADSASVSATKPFHGHALGASGAIEAAITCLAIRDSWAPPTLNLDAVGDGCDLDYVIGSGREQNIEVALSNSFGFGGINAVLLLTGSDVRP